MAIDTGAIIISIFGAYNVGVTAYIAHLNAEIKRNRKDLKDMKDAQKESDKKVEEYQILSERVFNTFDKFRFLVLHMVRLVRKGIPVPEELLDDIEKIPEVDELRKAHGR